MINIGIDARLLYYRSSGGTATYIRQLVQHLAQQDTDNDYAIVHHVRDAQTLAPSPNIRRANTVTPAHHRFERTLLASEILRLGLDVFHATDFIPPRFGAPRIVITVHDLNFLHFPEFHTRDSLRYYTGNIRAAVNQADTILAVSQATRNDLIQRLKVPPDKIVVQGQGIAKHFQPMQPEAQAAVLAKFELSTGYILHVGTLEPRKNIPKLLQAYHALRQIERETPPLVLVGRRGWLYEQIFQTVQDLKLEEDVHFLEDVRDEELPALYNGASMLVFVSHYEGFGMPAAEAMACGTPVIASDRSSLPEVVGKAGIIVNPDDQDAITHAMQRVLNDTHLRSDCISDGFNQAKRFTWERVARIVHGVYLQQMAGV